MMDRVCAGVALAAAIALAAVGVVYGTRAAGGSDSSCYALTAQACGIPVAGTEEMKK